MHGRVQAAALQVKPQLLGQCQAKAALLGLWKITKQKVAPTWRLRLDNCQQRHQTLSQGGKQLFQA